MAEGLFYSAEVNVQLLLSLMKAHGIRKVIISPGATNVAFTGSIRQDPYFELYSSVDERSAAYMACGMAAESGEPVALSCTGATASRNYMPGLTEAFYRKLPVLAITSSQRFYSVGQLHPQIIDRSEQPADLVRTSLRLPLLVAKPTITAYAVKVNAALLELRRDGGGPVHIDLETGKSKDFNVKKLPEFNVIRRYVTADTFPPIPAGTRVAISVGAHKPFTKEQEAAVDKFCAAYDAVVFTDHSSGYKGKYGVLATIIATQSNATEFDDLLKPDLLIYIGEQSGDYYMLGKLRGAKDVWRVSPDGEVRSPFGKLRNVFQMSEQEFFSRYAETAPPAEVRDTYLKKLLAATEKLYAQIPDVPFSNIWVAKTTAPRLPEGCAVHLGVSNTMRSWTFFNLPKSVMSCANLGCRGIDGALSSALGMSLANRNRIHFCMVGDLTFFYDMNALGNRYVGNNLRILLVNNGRGTEFRMYNHYAARFGEDADPFIAAAGHFGNKSPDLVRHYAQDLGFEYLTASSKEEFLQQVEHFVSPEKFDKPIVFEVFTDSKEESDALRAIKNFVKSPAPKSAPAPKPAPKFELEPQTVAPKSAPAPKPAPKFELEPQPVAPKSAPAPKPAPKFELEHQTVAPKSAPAPKPAPKFELEPQPVAPKSAPAPKPAPKFELEPQPVAPKSAPAPKPAPKFELEPQIPSAAPASEKKFELFPIADAPVDQKKNDLIPSEKARLGFGILRLPLLKDGNIDVQEVRRMVDEYMKGDFCYFDTHPAYCKHKSQSIVRELVVKRYPRESFLLADKMPWPIKATSDYERIFAAELKDCAVEYFDYYLLHALAEQYYQMHERFGGFEFLKKLKAQGLARHIGFSFHDKPDVLEKILSAHPEIEFVQLQINYLDWDDPFYQARKLYETAKRFGKKIMVMEPIKGGALANLEKFQIGNLDRATFARTALRFVASLDVDVILSGMNALEHVIENRQTLAEPVTLTEDDKKLYPKIIDTIKAAHQIPCTACRYCEAECPKKIPIPDIFALLNNHRSNRGENDRAYLGRARNHYRRYFFDGPKASDCIACGACARRCPQRIHIPEHIREAAKLFEGK